MKLPKILHSQTWPARRLCSHRVEAGGFVFLLSDGDDIPAAVVALRASVDLDGDGKLWVDLYSRPTAAVVTRRVPTPTDNAGGPALKDIVADMCTNCEGTGQTYGSGGGPACEDCAGTGVARLRLLMTAPAQWLPAPGAVATAIGEFVEVIAGPCGGGKMRPRMGPILERLMQAGGAAVTPGSNNAEAMVREAEQAMRTLAPQHFATFAAVTRVLVGEDEQPAGAEPTETN